MKWKHYNFKSFLKEFKIRDKEIWKNITDIDENLKKLDGSSYQTKNEFTNELNSRFIIERNSLKLKFEDNKNKKLDKFKSSKKVFIF